MPRSPVFFLFYCVCFAACVGSDPDAVPAAPGADAGGTSSSGSAGSPDAGGAGPDASSPAAGSFALRTESADATVFEGAETTVKVLLTRTGFKNAVTVTASGFGNGVTIAPLEIGAGGTEGTLTIKAGVGAVHGSTTVTIKGVADGAADQTAELKLLVRSAPGTFDNSFGTAGKITGTGSVTGLALQSDGKIVVVGNTSGESFAARHDVDGKPDPSFGVSGRVTLPLLTAADVVVRADGKIFVAGDKRNGTIDQFAVTRLSEKGVVETGFGTNGTREFFEPGTSNSFATSIGVDAAGNILVSGYRFDGTGGLYDFTVLRLTGDDGHLDPAFSGDGFDDLDFNGGGFDMAHGMAVKPDGTVVVAGAGDQPNAFALARYLPTGAPDTGLKGNGHTTLAFPSTKTSTGLAVANQPDNKMVVVGYLSPSSGSDEPVIARFEAGGSPDANFGTGGSTITPVSTGADRYASVALQPNGAIVVAGFTQGQFLVARYTSAGVLDPSFATTGIVKTTFSGEGDAATRLSLQPDGRIVVAGTVGASNYGVVRYWH